MVLTVESYLNSLNSGNEIIASPQDLAMLFALPSFLATIFYSSAVAGTVGNFIGRGGMAYFFTMPVKRAGLFISMLIISVSASSLLFLSSLLLIAYLTTFSIASETYLYLFLMMFTLTAFYSSIGFLVSALTGKGSASFVSVMLTFLTLSFYSPKILYNSPTAQYILNGMLFVTLHSYSLSDTVVPSAFLLLISVLILFLSYFTYTLKDHRSGRAA